MTTPDSPTNTGDYVHPTIDGRPVLIGERLRATDPDSVGESGKPFVVEGQVVSIVHDRDADYAILIKPDEGLTEEFYFPHSTFERLSTDNDRTAGRWSCTKDGATEPCGDCDGCRYDATSSGRSQGDG